jgi:FMN reductase
MRTTIVVGNPRAGSRTLGVAIAVANALVVPSTSSEQTVVDLADIASELFKPDSVAVAALLEEAAESDLLVVASPTYKATYTGLLKVFLDRYGNDALRSTVAVPVMTGGAPMHALAPEVFLRPLLIELGASVPSRALFVTEDELENLNAVVAAWALTAGPLIRGALGRDRIH